MVLVIEYYGTTIITITIMIIIMIIISIGSSSILLTHFDQFEDW